MDGRGFPIRAYVQSSAAVLKLFYDEPEGDRWLPLDRYPRRIVRRLVRGKPLIWGQRRIFLNLCAGLDRIGVPYSVNDYRWAKRNPSALACIVGKPYVLDVTQWKNPILFGPCGHSHPVEDPNLLDRLPIKKILVLGPWHKAMCRPYWGETVEAWEAGIETDIWQPTDASRKDTDVLLYDKVRWEHDRYEKSLIDPIRAFLRAQGRSVCELRYGFYREDELRAALARCKTMIFLCEHETQGIAYQQALSCGVPILAWDRGGFWQDPEFYPHRVKFAPVSSVPYWDDRCGIKFASIEGFDDAWRRFWDEFQSGGYDPRAYILDNLTLEQCAQRYLRQVQSVSGG
jgi:glycosyltransferase involved in cell wall biosynthesis